MVGGSGARPQGHVQPPHDLDAAGVTVASGVRHVVVDGVDAGQALASTLKNRNYVIEPLWVLL